MKMIQLYGVGVNVGAGAHSLVTGDSSHFTNAIQTYPWLLSGMFQEVITVTAADRARGYRTIALAAELFGDYLLTAGVGAVAKGASWLVRTAKYADKVHDVAFAADKLGDASRALRQIDTFTPDGLATLARELPDGTLVKLDSAGNLVAQAPNGIPLSAGTSRWLDDLASTRIDAIPIDDWHGPGIGRSNYHTLAEFRDAVFVKYQQFLIRQIQ